MLPDVISIGTGIGIGSIQLAITRQYITEPKWNTYGNIALGAIALGITAFTNIIKNEKIETIALTYGFTTFLGGILAGALPMALQALGVQPVATLSYGRDGYISHEYYPRYTGTFIDRPASRARGFASDVTRNPMAAIPTTIPYNKIIF